MSTSAGQWYMYKIVAEDGRVLYSEKRLGDIEQARRRQRCGKALLDIALGESLRKLGGVEG